MSEEETNDDQPKYTIWDIPSDEWEPLERDPDLDFDEGADLKLPDYFLEQVRKFIERN